MRALCRALRVDLRRGVCSRLFLLTVVLLLAWLISNNGENLTSQMSRRTVSVAEMLNHTLIGKVSLVELVLAIASVAYGWSYCHDRACGFFPQVVARVGMPAYSRARAVTVAASAFLAGVIALGLYLLYLTALHLPKPDLQTVGGHAYLDLVAQGRSGLYFAVRIIILGLTCSFAAEFGLMVTAFCPNAYMAILSPVMLYYLQQMLGMVIRMDSKWYLLRVMFGQTYDDAIQSFLWAVGYLTIGTALCGLIFCRRLRKEQVS